MRYGLSDYERTVIKPMWPNKPRGVPGVDDRPSSMAPFGSCDQVRPGVICPRTTDLMPLAAIGLMSPRPS